MRLGLVLSLCLCLLSVSVPAEAAGKLETKLTELSHQGNGEAAYHLGMLYHLGIGGARKDPKKAFELFELSAERGDPLGAYKLGCYYDGQGEGVVEDDPDLALKYKMIAARAGYALAQEDVARHLFGTGDTKGGLQWLEAAAAQGNRMPAMALGGLYSGQMPDGFPNLPKDMVKSWIYLLIGARDTPEMRKSLEKEARKTLSKDELAQVTAAVATWRETPTVLTQKAGAGVEAAYKLAGLPIPKN